ncbi:hypothetical protein CAC42_1266 [Sphaceloma murrayae]|uniref:PHD-type domain-containing protein n=1 Tax=Sphaceloma murrayae TaxID=2082308 RepID=A0A2K1R2H1_9PEZI|nr:hypothetical protein CAC42_1266 [Sphaceloma murrayae]
MASTRSRTKEEAAPTCHILNYFYDQEQGFALTARVRTKRFHIMLAPERLESEEIRNEYLQLLKAVEGKDTPQESPSRKRKRDETDSGYGSSPVGGSPERRSQSSVTLAEDDREDNDAVRDLQNWCLEPFGEIFAEKAPVNEEGDTKTVHDWFHGQAFYYTLTAKASGTFQPIEEEPTKPLEKRVTDLIPGLRLPKYITSHHIPLFSTSSLHILETSATPSPLHPTLVRDTSSSTSHFLKLVDPSQPGPVKRELDLLLSLTSKSLDKKIRVPTLQGLVIDHPASSLPATSSKDSPISILGFLLTPIPDATPLTQYLDSDTAESHRERWAREIERTVKILHEGGIVWGDAKADNFMVDADNRLWIIDFGGSYTEGWVDADKADTMEGDEQGTERIVNAVRDPEGFTFDPDEEEDEDEGEEKQGRDGKRRRMAEEEDEVRELQNGDREAVEDEREEGNPAKEVYCYCEKPEQGKMIACDGDDCEKEWFHFECTGLKEIPARKEQWFCDNCKA